MASRQVFLNGDPIPLTRTEFDILAALSSRPGAVWSRRQLIDAVWGEPWVGNDHLVDVHVGHLRRKLGDDPTEPRFVFTVRGWATGWEPGDDAAAGDGDARAAAARPDTGAARRRSHHLGGRLGGRAAAIPRTSAPSRVEHNSNEQFHAEQAYQHATALSIAVAITVAASTAFVVTAYLSRRLQHSIAELSQAAAAIAEGHYDIRVAPPQLGDEFENLAGSFNQMAQRLQSVESTRRRRCSGTWRTKSGPRLRSWRLTWKPSRTA